MDAVLLTKEEDYKDTTTTLEIKCSCGDVIFFTKFRNIHKSKNPNACKCKICGGNNRAWSFGEVKHYVNNFTASTLITQFKNYQTIPLKSDLTLECRCGNLFTTTLNNILNAQKHTCYECSKETLSSARRTHVKDVYNRVLNRGYKIIKFLEPYKNAYSEFLVECKNGHRYATYYHNIVNKKRNCQQCVGNGLKSHEEFVNDVRDVAGEEYIPIGQYVSGKTKIKMRHNICGYEWDVEPISFLTGNRCPKCSGRVPYTHEDYVNKILELVGDEYTPIEQYKGGAIPVKLKHNICDYVWTVRPSNFFFGNRCPQCQESKGEQKVRLFLESKNVNFEREYSFENLLGIGGYPLRFDFAIFDSANNLKLLVEYDGEFHFGKLYDNDNFEIVQTHDEYKNQYCKDNNIPLLRIPYWDFDSIEQILDKYLNQLFKDKI